MQHPVDPEQVERLTALEPSGSQFYQNAEAALNQELDGIPAWWPNSDPETLDRLSAARRRIWCLEFLAGQWSVNEEILRALPDISSANCSH